MISHSSWPHTFLRLDVAYPLAALESLESMHDLHKIVKKLFDISAINVTLRKLRKRATCNGTDAIKSE